MKAYRQLSELHDPGSFGFWWTGITRNVIVDWQRRKTREKARFVDADLEDHEGHIAERQAAQSKSTELRAMIRELPEAERMALHLFVARNSFRSSLDLIELSQVAEHKRLVKVFSYPDSATEPIASNPTISVLKAVANQADWLKEIDATGEIIYGYEVVVR